MDIRTIIERVLVFVIVAALGIGSAIGFAIGMFWSVFAGIFTFGALVFEMGGHKTADFWGALFHPYGLLTALAVWGISYIIWLMIDAAA